MNKEEGRIRRKKRIRKKMIGTSERPRLVVFRSVKHIYAQVVDDLLGKTIAAASSALKEFPGSGGNVQGAKEVGKRIGEEALKKGIKKVVFDRGGYRYHGRVQALADAARESGLQF